MKTTPVILIFDVGKTNKKALLFDEQYKLVFEESKQLTEIKDEDGFSHGNRSPAFIEYREPVHEQPCLHRVSLS